MDDGSIAFLSLIQHQLRLLSPFFAKLLLYLLYSVYFILLSLWFSFWRQLYLEFILLTASFHLW
jgi:hypothetical protein